MQVHHGGGGQRRWQVWIGAAVLATLTACGGGGGGSKSSTPTSDGGVAEPASVDAREGAKIRLGGVVSKGRIAHAQVNVRPVNSDGTISSTSLATALTGSDGSYLTTEFTISGPYVVEVTALPCDDPSQQVNTSTPTCSYQHDEALGLDQYLPSGFKLRALVTATPADDRVNVTLFSELATRAALKASGGLTTGNMAQAQAMVNNLFGTTDLNTVVPTTLPAANQTIDLTPAQSRLAAMLTAASTVAGTPARLTALLDALTQAQPTAVTLPASCLDDGDRVDAATPQATLCVVDVLANNANINQYVGDVKAVSATLNDALLQVVTQSQSAELAAVTSTTSDKLTNDTLSVPAPASSTLAYDNVRAFFNDLVGTLRTLFTKTDGEATLKEAHAFDAAGQKMIFTGQVLISDNTALEMGVALWSQYDQGSGNVDSFQHRDMSYPSFVPSGHHCKLQKNDSTTGSGYADAVPTDPPSAITRAVCRADYYYAILNTVSGTYPNVTVNAVRVNHAFFIKRPTAGITDHYSYKAYALREEQTVDLDYAHQTASATTTSRTYLQTTTPGGSTSTALTDAAPADAIFFTGTVDATVNAAGEPLSLTVRGLAPDGVKDNTGELVHASATVVNNGHFDLLTLLTADRSANTATFQGTMNAYAASGTDVDYTITFTNGAISFLNQQALTLSFDGTLVSTTDKFTASVDLRRTPGTAGHADSLYAQHITGALYNLATSSSVPFIQASLQYAQDNTSFIPGAFSATNFKLHAVRFDGFVTAPSSPRVRVALTGAGKQMVDGYKFGLDTADAISGDYFIYNNSMGTSLKRDVTFTFKAQDDNTSGQARVTSEVVDPTNKVAFAFGYTGNNATGNASKADTKADVYVNKVKRGLLDTDTNLPTVYLLNGDNFSLDTGTIQY